MKAKSNEHCHLLAACAVALATAVGTGGSAQAFESRAIEKLEQYCTASWRNAGIKRDDWDDCTQQTLTELLEQIHRERLPEAIENVESSERRELNRAVWRLVQRQRRRTQNHSYDDNRTPIQAVREQRTSDRDWNQVVELASEVLTDRQFEILRLMREGWRVAEIAEELNTSPQRVSDEKYKAIAKLRDHLTNDPANGTSTGDDQIGTIARA